MSWVRRVARRWLQTLCPNIITQLFQLFRLFVLFQILWPSSILAVVFPVARKLQQSSPSFVVKGRYGRTSVECRSGFDLVQALGDSAVQTVLVTTDIVLSAADFATDEGPIHLSRNLTIMGPHEESDAWPLLDLGFVHEWVKLGAGVTLNFTQLVLDRVRKGPYFQTPGMDIVAFTPRNPALPYALVVVWRCAYIQRTCLPDWLYKDSTNTLRRPEELPGMQLADRIAPLEPCSREPQVPAMRRCWLRRGKYEDIAVYGSDLVGVALTLTYNNYILWTNDVYYLCNVIMADDCVRAKGPVYCYYVMFPHGNQTTARSRQAPTPTPSSASTPDSTEGDQLLEQQREKQQEAASAEGQQVRDKAAGLVPLLGGALGGLAGLAVVAAVLGVAARRWMQEADDGVGVGNSVRALISQSTPLPIVVSNSSSSDARCVKEGASAALEDIGLGDSNGDAYDTSSRGPNSIRVTHLGPSDGAANASGRSADGAAFSGEMIQLTSCRSPQGTPAGAGAVNRYPLTDDSIQAPVTLQTPMQGAVRRGADLKAGEVQLSAVVLGKGAFGRVVEGVYAGVRVAVKLLNAGLMEQALAAATAADKAQTTPGSGGAAVAVICSPQLPQQQQQQQQQEDEQALQKQWVQQSVSVEQQHQRQWQKLQQQQQQRAEETCKRAKAFTASLLQEVTVLARCQHPNIVRLLAARLEPPHMCLVVELMETSLERLLYGEGGEEGEGGSVGVTAGAARQVLAREEEYGGEGGDVSVPSVRPSSPMPLEKVLHIGMQIARALSYLHPTILHRDLKPGNVLLSQPHSPRPVVKLADFGLSRLQDTVLVTRNPEVGTAPYMAPETFDLNNHTVTDRVDIYALGVVIWEMLSGSRPWEGSSAMQIACNVTLRGLRLPLEALGGERCPAKLRGLIESCWEADPPRRPAAAEVLKTLALLAEQVQRAPP